MGPLNMKGWDMQQIILASTAVLALVGAGVVAGANLRTERADRVFEMRTYIANPGKITALHARFRDHTNKLFVKHGMELVGYWTPTSGDNAENTLIYILAFPSEEAKVKAWKEFQADPDWVKAKAESEKDGVLVSKVISVFMTGTEYSAIK
jgi:hypothetical protein